MKLSYEQWCGVVSSFILFGICYGFDTRNMPWWIMTMIVVALIATVLALWNFKFTISYLKVGRFTIIGRTKKKKGKGK